MPQVVAVIFTVALLSMGCATDLGTGVAVMEKIEEAYPITVGKLVAAHMDQSRRLRVYVSLCHENPTGPVCGRDEPRVLAMVESGERRLLERLAERYLVEGRDKPVYVYGPMCDGMEEMVVVPRCQTAIALGVWDPYLNDYIVYSTLHGDSMMESEGFENFLEVTGKAAGMVRKAAKFVP
jgi:hypothetical protein